MNRPTDKQDQEHGSAGEVIGELTSSYINNPDSRIFMAQNEQYIAILVKKDSGELVGGRANEVGPNAYKPLESVLGEPERAFTVLRGGLVG